LGGIIVNNPLIFIDPDGRKIIAVNEKSRNELNKMFANVYKGDQFKSFRSLMTVNTKTNEYSSISKSDFNKTTKGLNKKERALAKAYYKAVNSKEKHYVDIVTSNNEKFSESTQKQEVLKSGKDLEAMGGGVNIAKRGDSGDTLTLLNTNTQSDYNAVNNKRENVTVPGYTQKEAIMVHELLGHAIDPNNPISASLVENIYHKVQNTGLEVDGADHNNGKPIPKAKRTEIPNHLKDESP
jgi:hypothetical protein